MDDLAARIRHAVSMRLRGCSYSAIVRACGFADAAEARAAVNEYSEKWFSNG